MRHPQPHPLAGQTVTIAEGVIDPVQKMVEAGALYRVEDYWDRVYGDSWTNAQGNPAAMQYAIRSGLAKKRVPIDDEVLYGKIGTLGHLVHISEIDTSPT